MKISARRRLLTVGALGLVAIVLAACSSGSGSSSSSSSASGGASSAGPVAPLTIAIGASVPDFMQPYIAQAQGYFDKENVKVNFTENTGANTLNLVVGGSADLAMSTAPSALQAAAQGKSTTIVYAVERDPGAALIGGPKVASISDLQSMSSCRLATFPANSQIYSYALVYQKSLNLKCDLVVVNTIPLMLAGLASGSYQAMIGTATTAASAITAGNHTLIDPTNPNDIKNYGVPPYPTATFFGLTDNLKSKAASVTRFLKAIDEANTYIHKTQATDLASQLHAVASFAVTPEATLAGQIALVIPYVGAGLGPPAGSISSDLWTNALKQYANWGIAGFDQTAAVNSYAQRVDMSYLTNALK